MSKALLDGLDEAERMSWRRTSNSCGIEYFAPHISAARTNGELAIGSFEAHARDLLKQLALSSAEGQGSGAPGRKEAPKASCTGRNHPLVDSAAGCPQN